MKKGLNAAQLKMIAVIAMVCDHIVPLIPYTENINLWYLAIVKYLI